MGRMGYRVPREPEADWRCVVDTALVYDARGILHELDSVVPSQIARPGNAERTCLRRAPDWAEYAAETAAPVTGKRISRTGKHAKRIQSVLGDHHDAVMTRATLRHLALDEASGEAATFLLGHLDADEQRATRKLEERAWRKIDALEEHIATDQ
ncbi:CHAD domain-containing protein [Terrabacter sp. GCM10028922]|uniref:CHAD domain-containing protein n=1 Tax=Terrabacter sp. GCM10028922 TaxID=3273428 RepID=UPI00361F0F36